MRFWENKHEKKESQNTDIFLEAIAENDVKSGYVKIYYVESKDKKRPESAFVAKRTLREIAKTPIELFLGSEYGGGKYKVMLYKVDKGSDLYVDEFSYNIFGDKLSEEDSSKGNKLDELAYSALTERIKGGNGTNDELMKLIISKALDKDDEFRKTLENMGLLKDLITPQVPVIPAETTEGKLIDAGAQIISAVLSRGGGALPPIVQQFLAQNPNLANMPLPDRIGPSEISQLTSGNGNKPITKIEAFETLFITPFKEMAAQSDERRLAGMIETMAVDSLLWLDANDYHPVIKEFVDGYETVNLAQLASGFDSLMTYAEIPNEKAGNIKKMLLVSYQAQYKENADNKQDDNSGVIANE